MRDDTMNPDFDAQILLCCALGAISAKLWPRQQDSLRFVQMLIDFSPPELDLRTVSIPRLMWSLEESSAHAVKAAFDHFPPALVLAAREIDKDEQTVQSVIPGTSLRKIRESSYAGIIYSDLRCGLVHEYELQETITDWTAGEQSKLMLY